MCITTVPTDDEDIYEGSGEEDEEEYSNGCYGDPGPQGEIGLPGLKGETGPQGIQGPAVSS